MPQNLSNFFISIIEVFSILDDAHRALLFDEIERARKIDTHREDVKMVMIDDQPIPKKEKAVHFSPIISQMFEMGIDFITFELDLNKAKEEWLLG